MRKFISSGLIVLMIIGLCSFAYGQERNTAYTKGERGLKNVVLGWTEIPKGVIDKTKEKNVIYGLTIGLLEGTLNALARTVSGTADVTTAPIGSYKSEPVIKPTVTE